METVSIDNRRYTKISKRVFNLSSKTSVFVSGPCPTCVEHVMHHDSVYKALGFTSKYCLKHKRLSRGRSDKTILA
jgi:hypothetical protein